METGISGAEDITQIQQAKMQRKYRNIFKIKLKEDLEYDQMTLKEYIDPFTGEPVKTNRQNKPKGLSR